MAAVNVDARMAGADGVVSLANGCICCSLRSNLMAEVAAMAARGGLDGIVVECSGIAEPRQIEAGFRAPPPPPPAASTSATDRRSESYTVAVGVGVRRAFELDTMVTVVDADAFLAHYGSDGTVGGSAEFREGEGAAAGDGRRIVDLLTDQVEVADVVLLNKVDLVDAAQLQRLQAIVASLNPSAAVHPVFFGRISPEHVLRTGRSQRRSAAALRPLVPAASFGSTLSGQAGVTSFVWRARRPFHPGRLHNLVVDWREAGMLRSKGFICVAEPGDVRQLIGQHAGTYWAQSGRHLRLHEAEACCYHMKQHWNQDKAAGLLATRIATEHMDCG